MDTTTKRRRTRGSVAAMALVAVISSGATYAVAGHGSKADLSRGDPAASGVAAKVTAQTTSGPCKAGYDTQTSTNTPPDDGTADNAPAASVKIRKTCAGAVTAVFTSEVSLPEAGDFLHIDMRATCVATKHLVDPCTPGAEVFASPGHSFFQNGQVPLHSEAIQMVWPTLQRGVWRFEVLPGGNASANLQFRSLVVTAYEGG